MVGNVDVIDGKGFPVVQNEDFLFSTITEAYLQHITISMIENINFSHGGKYVEIIYIEKNSEKSK